VKTKIGIALGGGGAKGIAHVPMLEVLDEFDIMPHQISGTSIGAAIGVLYATGYSGREIRDGINQVSYLDGDGFIDSMTKKDLLKWFEFIDIDWSGNAFLKADTFMAELMRDVKVTRFDELKIPLKVVAVDFWSRTQTVFDSGELKPALQASMSLPGIFVPTVRNGKVYVDGGAVNPVPFDLLDECDFVIAINVMGTRTESHNLIPTFSEAVFNTFQIMQTTILQQKLIEHPPDIYITPEIVDVQVLEFYKADQIFRQAELAKDELRRQIEALLEPL
jgi:NTE family protein